MKSYEKILLASLGLVSMSVKEAERLLKTISKKKISEKGAKKTFAELVAEGKKSKRESIEKLKTLLKKVLEELNIPTRDEFAVLKNKVDALKK